MNNTVFGFAAVAVTGAWIAILTGIGALIYNALGGLRCALLAVFVVLALAGIFFWREIAANKEPKQ